MRLTTFASIIVSVLGLSHAADSDVFVGIDLDNNVGVAAVRDDEHRLLVANCPLPGPDIRYVPPPLTCKSSYGCITNWEKFKITGCGCGCHRVSTGTTTCPVLASKDIVYRSRSTSTCSALVFTCIQSWARFDIAGCGCGCRKVSNAPTAPITPTKPVAPTKPKPIATRPVSSPTSLRNASVVCPSGSNFIYRSHAEPCHKTFRCLRGREFFSVPGCGCGCKVISPSTSPVKRPTTKPSK